MSDPQGTEDRAPLQLLVRDVSRSQEREEAVRQMVREQLERPREPSSAALYGRAARIDRRIRTLDLRQFVARYVLPEKRRRKRRIRARRRERGLRAGGRPQTPPPRRAGRSEAREELRALIRETLLQVAREAAEADSAAAAIDLVESIERHTARLAERVEALRRGRSRGG